MKKQRKNRQSRGQRLRRTNRTCAENLDALLREYSYIFRLARFLCRRNVVTHESSPFYRFSLSLVPTCMPVVLSPVFRQDDILSRRRERFVDPVVRKLRRIAYYSRWCSKLGQSCVSALSAGLANPVFYRYFLHTLIHTHTHVYVYYMYIVKMDI